MDRHPAPYTIAMIQMACTFLDNDANLQKAEKYIREATSEGATLICLPESFNQGYISTRTEEMLPHAETETGKTLTWACALAKELSIHLLAPIFFLNEVGTIENRAFLINDEGVILGGYTKTHPVGDERTLLCRGNQYPVFCTKLGNIGISICYDACFPETSRILALNGAELILVPAAWRGNFYFKEWWDMNLCCRAIDNLVYVAAVNMTGPTGDQHFAGKTQVCDPIGQRIATCGVDEETILYAQIDMKQLSESRDFNTVLTDRHPEDYITLQNQYQKEEKS